MRGIDGSTRENGRVTLQKVTNFFRDVLKTPTYLLEDMQFQACQRLPGGNNSDKRYITATWKGRSRGDPKIMSQSSK